MNMPAPLHGSGAGGMGAMDHVWDSIGSRRPACYRIAAAPSPAGFWPRLPVLALLTRHAPEPTLILSANRGHLEWMVGYGAHQALRSRKGPCRRA